jgi:hypothetical protein
MFHRKFETGPGKLRLFIGVIYPFQFCTYCRRSPFAVRVIFSSWNFQYSSHKKEIKPYILMSLNNPSNRIIFLEMLWTSFRVSRIQSKSEQESDIFSGIICRAAWNVHYSETPVIGRHNSLNLQWLWLPPGRLVTLPTRYLRQTSLKTIHFSWSTKKELLKANKTVNTGRENSPTSSLRLKILLSVVAV